MHFTEKKFQSLSKYSQHKKIAELLKKLYYHFDNDFLFQIQQLEEWLGVKWTVNSQPETIANSFHKHLKCAGIGISEHALLVKQYDRFEASETWLNIDIYLDHLRSAHNIGSILRTTEAFRLGTLIFSPDMPTNTHPQVIKTSMGAAGLIKTKPYLENCKKKPLIIVETHKNSIPLEEFVFPQSFTLVLGNEEYGVSKEFLEKADHIIEVQLCGQKNSLNVASCFSILAWKINLDLRAKV